MWAQLRTADQARAALMDVLPALVQGYGAAAATVSADWYDDTREETGVRRRFIAIPAEPGGGTDELARWGIGPLFSAEPDWASARTLIAGGLQRRIADAGRDTVRDSSIADPSARGWQREGVGGCGFCTMLIGRGAVYSEASVGFASHDHCSCVAVPAFDGEPKPVEPYTPSGRRVSDADRARVREYIRTH